MPNRIIKETINESRALNDCSVFAQDLFKRLITYADDNGRFNADTQIMLARLYPRDLDIVSQEDVVNGLIELSGIGKIEFYTAKVFSNRGASDVYAICVLSRKRGIYMWEVCKRPRRRRRRKWRKI